MLVEIIGKRYEEKLITTSLKVAEHFEKEHKNVIQAIENLTAENSAASLSGNKKGGPSGPPNYFSYLHLCQFFLRCIPSAPYLYTG